MSNGRDLVLVDTGIWAAFFSNPASPEKQAIDELLDHDRVALTGPIIGEVLRGFRRKEQADWVASRLKLAHYLEATWEDWRDAAGIARELAAKGHDLPLTDVVIAAVALRPHALAKAISPKLKRPESAFRDTAFQDSMLSHPASAPTCGLRQGNSGALARGLRSEPLLFGLVSRYFRLRPTRRPADVCGGTNGRQPFRFDLKV